MTSLIVLLVSVLVNHLGICSYITIFTVFVLASIFTLLNSFCMDHIKAHIDKNQGLYMNLRLTSVPT